MNTAYNPVWPTYWLEKWLRPDLQAQQQAQISGTVSAIADDPGLLWDAATADIRQDWNNGKRSEAAGAAVFDVVSLLWGGAGLVKAANTSKATKVADALAEAAPAVADDAAVMGGGAGSVVRVHNPGGMTQIGRDTNTVSAAAWAPKSSGTNSVAVHGFPSGWANPVTTGDVVAAMKSHPEFDAAGTACLWSCYSGSNGTGQEIANELGQVVRAPMGKVTVFSDPGLEPIAEGGWVTLHPEQK